MKRPLATIIVPIACLLMLPFCLQPGSALGGDKVRSHAAGNFQLDIGGNDKGWVQSVEGGSATPDTVQEKLGPVPKQAAPKQSGVVPPARNLQTPPQVARPLQPACPHPPCGLGQHHARTTTELRTAQEQQQDQKDSLGDLSEEKAARLQAAQERRAKQSEILSNTLKKNSETQSTITGNMK